MKIILASTSVYRKQLLERLGFDFVCEDPELDERPFQELGLSPQDLAERLAYEKARAVFNRYPDCIVLGGDQLGEIEGQILGKPHSFENAFSQIKMMNNKSHSLITSICILSPGNEKIYTDITKLKMRNLSDDQIKTYLNKDEPYDCAGSYKLECLGISLFESIDGDDHNSIMGLPLMKLAQIFTDLGVRIP